MRGLVTLLVAAVTAVMTITGMLSFFVPFSSQTSRIHAFFGLFFILLIGVHIYHNKKRFFKYVGIRSWKKSGHFRSLGFIIFATLFFMAWENLLPVRAWLGLSYEERRKEVIFRAHPKTATQQLGGNLELKRPSSGLNISLDVELNEEQLKDDSLFIAIWVEDEEGRLIETLFLSEELAYKEQISYLDKELHRKEILPIWWFKWRSFLKRQKKLLVDDEVDAVSSATIHGSFNIDLLLKSGLPGFRVCLELNLTNDENSLFREDSKNFLAKTPKGIGQPSVIYSNFIDLQDENSSKYSLLEFKGRGDAAGEDGEVTQNYSGLTTALKILEKALLKVE